MYRPHPTSGHPAKSIYELCTWLVTVPQSPNLLPNHEYFQNILLIQATQFHAVTDLSSSRNRDYSSHILGRNF
jgi:hypothetical protein